MKGIVKIKKIHVGDRINGKKIVEVVHRLHCGYVRVVLEGGRVSWMVTRARWWRWKGGRLVKLNSAAIRAVMRGKKTWNWRKCVPLVALATGFVVLVLATILQSWFLSQTPVEVWESIFCIPKF